MRDYILSAPDEAALQAALPDYYDSEEGAWTGAVIAGATIWIERPTPGDDETPGTPGQKQGGYHLILRANSLPETAAPYLVEGEPDIEPVFAGGLITEPTPDLAEAKRRKRRRVDDERDRRISEGFSWNSIPIDTRNKDDFDNIAGVAQMAGRLKEQGVTQPIISFRAADNSTHMLTPEQALDLGEAAFMHKSSHFVASWPIKDAITAATTHAELDSIDVEQGWP